MASLNRVFLAGNLTKDPELRFVPSGQAVANLRMAVNRRWKGNNGEWKEETCFVGVVVWGKSAEACGEYLKKGSQVYIEGPIQTRQWEDRDGQTKYTTEIKALTLTMLDSKGDRSGDTRVVPDKPQGTGSSKPVDSKVELDEDFDDLDDDLPF